MRMVICGALPCRKWTTGYGTTTAVSICWAEPADTVQRVSGVIDCGGRMGADLAKG